MAGNNLKESQQSMKEWYDRNTFRKGHFNQADKVLALLLYCRKSTAGTDILDHMWLKSRCGNLDYILLTPDSTKEETVMPRKHAEKVC